ncbi:MAG: type II secretion system minor pseudopilin GspK [Gammaproteobacteria bacterium]|nr:type II secretion system minor pseudopilin GspK [Gammaproteobacteria bacterium]
MTGARIVNPGLKTARGVALLTVLFILVLISTLAVYLVEDEHLAIRRVTNQRDIEQAHQMLVGAEQWAIKVLERDENENDHLNEPWNKLLPKVGVEEGSLLAFVRDQQGLFNLNNLIEGKPSPNGKDPDGKDEEPKLWYPAFVRLLTVLELDEGLADAVLDWIDSDQDVSGGSGAEDAEYLLKEPSMRAADRLFTSIGELAWVHGFDAKALAMLRPYVTALPEPSKINVNTAPAPVLRILSADIMSEQEAEAIVQGRGAAGYTSTNDVLSLTQFAGQEGQSAAQLIDVKSGYFEIVSEAKFGRFKSSLLSLVQRKAGRAVVLGRRRGIS